MRTTLAFVCIPSPCVIITVQVALPSTTAISCFTKAILQNVWNFYSTFARYGRACRYSFCIFLVLLYFRTFVLSSSLLFSFFIQLKAVAFDSQQKEFLSMAQWQCGETDDLGAVYFSPPSASDVPTESLTQFNAKHVPLFETMIELMNKVK